MAGKKTVKTANVLGKLTPQQSKEFAAQYNGGLGSGMTPAEYKAKYGGGKKTGSSKGKKK